MNSIEQENINSYFDGNSEGKTMEDYFKEIQIVIGGAMSIDELKNAMKQSYPDETDWSF
tara:strand:+ start:1787 stop:1963 length:177 start_codon:yes stop_codon:yes gene_type:complete